MAGVLVCDAKPQHLNPTFDKDEIKRALADDPYMAASEYKNEWAEPVGAFVDRARVRIMTGIREQAPPANGTVYVGLDINGGSERGDAYAAVLAHEGHERKIILDAVHVWRGRTDPLAVSEELAKILQPYKGRIYVVGDRYTAQWSPSFFRRLGIDYHAPHLLPGGGRTRMSASDYYLSLLGLFARIEWLDHDKLLAELYNLVRAPDGVTHQGGHDDMINAAARSIYACAHTIDQREQQEQDDDEPPGGYITDDDEITLVSGKRDALIDTIAAMGYTRDQVIAVLDGRAQCVCRTGAVCALHTMEAELTAARRKRHEEQRAQAWLPPGPPQPRPPQKPTLEQVERDVAMLEDILEGDTTQRRLERGLGTLYTHDDFANSKPLNW